MLRKDATEKLSKAIFDAVTAKKIKSESDVVEIIRVATMTPKQLAKIDDEIKATEKKLESLRLLKENTE